MYRIKYDENEKFRQLENIIVKHKSIQGNESKVETIRGSTKIINCVSLSPHRLN